MRKNDNEKNEIFFRSSDRFVRVDGQWWFTTRDGDQGPFATRENAVLALKRYVDGVEMLNKHQAKVSAGREEAARGDPTIWARQIDS